MKTKTLPCLLLISLMLSAVCFAADHPNARFPHKEHLSALEIYRTGITKQYENIGKFVILDVVVTIEREVPLVEITAPQEFKDEKPLHHPISAHLISATTSASSLKKDDKVKIEGMIVDEAFGAYTIYLYRVLEK